MKKKKERTWQLSDHGVMGNGFIRELHTANSTDAVVVT